MPRPPSPVCIKFYIHPPPSALSCCHFFLRPLLISQPPPPLFQVIIAQSLRESSMCIIIHQTHYEKSDWSRAFNQFTIACELDMINAISAADIAFIMSSSTSAWLLSPLECSPQKQNG